MQYTFQPELPLEDGREISEVWWFNVRVTEKPRWLGRYGKVAISNDIEDENGLTTITRIRAEEISRIKDPDLRYALCFAAAADANKDHDVTITATDEGFDSRLVSAIYSGIVTRKGDTFMESLHRFAPIANENH